MLIRRLKRVLGLWPPRVVETVRNANLTYLEPEALLDLYERAVELEQRRIDGVLVEAGCALGGSAIVLTAAKASARPLYVYDVFDMIPPPSEKDGADVHRRYEIIRSGKSTGIGEGKYYGYESDLLAKVKDNFAQCGFPVERNNVHLVKGLFQDTINLDVPVAMAHIDGDWYESVTSCLTRLVPRLAKGGILVIDDYDAWSGCRDAVDSYFGSCRDQFEFIRRSRLHIRRI